MQQTNCLRWLQAIFYFGVVLTTATIFLHQTLSLTNFQYGRINLLRTTAQKQLYKIPIPISVLNKDNISFDSTFDILPRSVYFDSRARDGHKNATVFLVQISKVAIKKSLVVGCGVDNAFTKKFKLEVLRQYFTWVHIKKPLLTHDEAMLHCYDLPAQQGSRAFVYYIEKKTQQRVKLEAEKRLHMPSKLPHSKKGGRKSSIVVCTTMYGSPSWLREWLVYQKTIGADFIHINAQESFVECGGQLGANNSVLKAYIESGYAKLDVWKAYLNKSQSYYYQQPLLYVDCLYRYQTVFDYAFFYDTDDFFVPVIPNRTDIHYYAENLLFQNKKIAAATFHWVRYHPERGLTKDAETIEDGNITKYLKDPEAAEPKNYKSMYKILGVVDNQVHTAGRLLPGYKTSYVPIQYAYVAHHRTKWPQCKP